VVRLKQPGARGTGPSGRGGTARNVRVGFSSDSSPFTVVAPASSLVDGESHADSVSFPKAFQSIVLVFLDGKQWRKE
jgi:hypothetical protein